MSKTIPNCLFSSVRSLLCFALHIAEELLISGAVECLASSYHGYTLLANCYDFCLYSIIVLQLIWTQPLRWMRSESKFLSFFFLVIVDIFLAYLSICDFILFGLFGSYFLLSQLFVYKIKNQAFPSTPLGPLGTS